VRSAMEIIIALFSRHDRPPGRPRWVSEQPGLRPLLRFFLRHRRFKTWRMSSPQRPVSTTI
jgi:hypothetical protein